MEGKNTDRRDGREHGLCESTAVSMDHVDKEDSAGRGAWFGRYRKSRRTRGSDDAYTRIDKVFNTNLISVLKASNTDDAL